MAGRLEGKVAFITGAARGQGRSHAVRFAEEGADIIAVDICKSVENVIIPGSTPEDLAATVEAVEALDRRIVATEVDVTDLAALQSAVDDGVAQVGRLDFILGNAGIGATGAPVHEMSPRIWQQTIDINLTGVWNSAKVAIPHIIEGGRGGSIVLTSSVGGLKAHPNISHYVAAKHGVVGLMRSLAVELGQYGIRSNSVHPTQVNSPMAMNEWTYKLFRPDLENPTQADFEPVSRMMHLLPTGWVECEDISNACVFLCSEEARYITGATIPIDAGALMR